MAESDNNNAAVFNNEIQKFCLCSNIPSTSLTIDHKINEICEIFEDDITIAKNTPKEIDDMVKQLFKSEEKIQSSEQVNSELGATALLHKDWANAPEFIPKSQKTYADAVCNVFNNNNIKLKRSSQLCPYASKDGLCKYLSGECNYLHGDTCEFCGLAVLHPYDQELRKKHQQDCIKQHEKNMEFAFGMARSKDKTCGICFEVVVEKTNGEQRFGILPNCGHCFCLSCIRKWRKSRHFENKIIRACPACRITSDFVCPSLYWVDKPDEKLKLIDNYKSVLSRKDCKYFNKGNGNCPFGNKCFYRHALADGRLCDVGPPQRQRRHHSINASDLEVLHQVILWDYLNERNGNNSFLVGPDDIDDTDEIFIDSEDGSDWSDWEFLFE